MKIAVDGDVSGKLWIDANGYARHGKDLYVHRTVAENALGRKLPKRAVVHHVNGNRLDNRNRNLVICQDQVYHMLLHRRQSVVDAGGNPNTDKWCSGCQTVHPKAAFSTTRSSADGLHCSCRAFTNRYRREKGLSRNKFDWKQRLHQQTRRAVKKGVASSCVYL